MTTWLRKCPEAAVDPAILEASDKETTRNWLRAFVKISCSNSVRNLALRASLSEDWLCRVLDVGKAAKHTPRLTLEAVKGIERAYRVVAPEPVRAAAARLQKNEAVRPVQTRSSVAKTRRLPTVYQRRANLAEARFQEKVGRCQIMEDSKVRLNIRPKAVDERWTMVISASGRYSAISKVNLTVAELPAYMSSTYRTADNHNVALIDEGRSAYLIGIGPMLCAALDKAAKHPKGTVRLDFDFKAKTIEYTVFVS